MAKGARVEATGLSAHERDRRPCRRVHRGLALGRGMKIDRLLMGESAAGQLSLDPTPEVADLLRRFSRWGVFGDHQSGAERILVVVAHDDVRQCENARDI